MRQVLQRTHRSRILHSTTRLQLRSKLLSERTTFNPVPTPKPKLSLEMKRRWESTKQQQTLLHSHRASRSPPSALRGEGGERRRGPGSPRSPRGGREEGARRPGEPAWLPPSFPPSPGRGPHQPFPAANTSRGGSPGLLDGPQTKEGRKRGRTGARRRRQPGSPRRARPPHPCALSRGQLWRRAK